MDQTNSESQVGFGERPLEERTQNAAALLCGTPYDDFTKFLSSLFEGFPDLAMPTRVHQMEQPDDYKALLRTFSLNEEMDVLMVFTGHGAEDALLGPPESTAPVINYTRFYDKGAVDFGPNVLVAFCCSSGAELGEFFRADENRAFMGFDAPIGFVVAGGPYSEWWRKILHKSTLKIISTSDTAELRNYVERLYLDAHEYFTSPEGQKNEWWFWMTLVIRSHLDALRIHGRE